MRKRIAYCAADFINKFAELSEDQPKPNKLAIAGLYYGLLDKCELHLEMSKKTFAEACCREDKIKKYLLPLIQSNGGANFDDYVSPENLPTENFDTTDYRSIYMVGKRNGESPSGVMLIDNTENRDSLILREKPYVKCFNDGEKGTWDFLKGLRLGVCNSIVVRDPYILEPIGLRNLKEILKILIPKKLNVPVHLAIFFRDLNIQKYDKQREILKDCFGENNIKLSFFNDSKKEIHDRHIITNNVIIKSSSGFDLFKNGQAVKEGEISVQFYVDLEDQDANHSLALFRKIRKKILSGKQTYIGSDNVGSRKHRLLDDPNLLED